MDKSLRIETTPGGDDKFVKININQDFDFIEILSLKLTQEEVYNKFCADYGVVVGRVIVNNGFGVPNAKVSVFIPISDEDRNDPEKYSLYPYEKTSDKNIEGLRYNLLTKKKVRDCHTPVGNFPQKREILDNEIKMEIYEKYYKFTTTTNDSGDYMIFGVPTGNHLIHVDVDMSDMGVISQRPYDFISKGYNADQFSSSTKFNKSNNLDTLSHIKTQDVGVNVVPFWGDEDNCQIGISRIDVDLKYDVITTAIFMGSIFGDSEKNSVNKNGRPRKKVGNINELVTSEGTIEMLRKTTDGSIERFDVKGGRVINDNGSWAYQVPMNLDYVVTNEFGKLIPSNDPNKGIPTRASVRFRISMDDTGSEGRVRTRGKFLVPNNPNDGNEVDYTFNENTLDTSFRDLKWNKLYTVKSFIPRIQPNKRIENKNFVGLKRLDDASGGVNPIPFNNLDTDGNPLFLLLCIFVTFFLDLIGILNSIIGFKIPIINKRPFCGLGCIGINCNGERYTPNCRCKNAGLSSKDDAKECFKFQLADALNIFSFEFYNDWLNGSLYYTLLKYKKTKTKEKYFDYDCQDFNGDSDNGCKESFIVDRCVSGGDGKDGSSEPLREGILKKFDDNLYYAAVSHNSGLNMFSTDIMELGAILDCDIDNVPVIFNELTSTTFNMPEEDEMESLLDIDCLGLKVSTQNCINLKRICEIGIGLDEDRETGETNPCCNQLTADGKFDNCEVENLYVRNVIGWLNDKTINTFEDSNMYFPGGTGICAQNNGYNDYRGYTNVGLNQPKNNSFYFYFGLNGGKTALNLARSKYFTTCLDVTENPLIILGNVTNVLIKGQSTGSIELDVSGGVGPYTYSWTDGNGFTSISEDIFNLVSGTYTVTVIDSNGVLNKRTFVVNEPPALNCYLSTTPVSNYGLSDGKILLNNIIGGVGPYKLEIFTLPGNTLIFTQNNILINDSVIVTNLSVGNYQYVLTDSILDTCKGELEIIEPEQLVVDVTSEDLICFDDDSGTISVEILQGTSPFTFNYYDSNGVLVPNSNSNFNQIFSAGTYTIEVIDALGNTVGGTVTLTQPSQIFLSSNDSGGTYILVNASGGSGGIYYTIVSGPVINDSGRNNGEFTGLSFGTYTIRATDTNNCFNEITITI